MELRKRLGADVELTEAGYDADGFIDELVYQISSLGIVWEYNDEAYRKYLEDWTLEELMSEADTHGMDTEEFKEVEE